MKVLFLCNKSPYPPKEGGPMAMNANIECLINAGHTVKVLALNTNKYFVRENEIPRDYKLKTSIEFIYHDLSINPIHAFLNLFSGKSFHVERFIAPAIERKIAEILLKDQYDIVQLEMLYMTPYIKVIRNNSKAKIILRSHNIEHLIWKRMTDSAKNPLKKVYFSLLTRKLKNYELSSMNEVDGIAAISNKDAEFYRQNGCQVPVSEIPFGLDLSTYHSSFHEAEFPSLFHIGAMNWMPNAEGVKWFIDEVWPLILSNFPGLKFYLAGRMMPDWLQNLKIQNIIVLGEVADAREFIRSKSIMVVPLLSGSGIRIKIMESMAMGKAIVSTKIGAEGIGYTIGNNLLIADTPGEFLDAIKKCIEDRDFCELLGKNAKELVNSKYGLEQVAQKLTGFYQTVLGK